MITELGKFLRQIRLDNSEILKDMANKLEVSSAFLSAVENGKKKMPEKWYSEIERIYHLNEEQVKALKTAVLESSDNLEIDISEASPVNRDLAISLARQFDSLDDETSQRILKILKKRKG